MPRKRTPAELKYLLKKAAATKRRDEQRLAAGWTYGPTDDAHGFMEHPHSQCVWTKPPRKPRQKKPPEPPVNPDVSKRQPRIDFGEK